MREGQNTKRVQGCLLAGYLCGVIAALPANQGNIVIRRGLEWRALKAHRKETHAPVACNTSETHLEWNDEKWR